jgi:hypothetical protein
MSTDQTEIRVTRETWRRIKPRRNQASPRQQLAYELAQRNWSLADIGRELGVTREGARQLVVRYEELRMARSERLRHIRSNRIRKLALVSQVNVMGHLMPTSFL